MHEQEPGIHQGIEVGSGCLSHSLELAAVCSHAGSVIGVFEQSAQQGFLAVVEFLLVAELVVQAFLFFGPALQVFQQI